MTYDPGPPVDARGGQVIRDYLAVEMKKTFLREHVGPLGSHRRLLDVGCGAGGYLLAAQELGFQAIGVEPSTAHSTIGRKLGLTIHDGFLVPGMFPPASFDVILLSHVIEHIYDPKLFLEMLAPLLKPSGLLIAVTPNAGSLIARLSGGSWVMLQPADHVSMLTAKSFQSMKLRGFDQIEFRQSEFAWEPLASLLSAGRRSLKETGKNFLTRRRESQSASTTGSPTSSPRRRSGIAWSSAFKPLRLGLVVVGWPLHALSVASDRQACLTAILRADGNAAIDPGGPSAKLEHGPVAEASSR